MVLVNFIITFLTIGGCYLFGVRGDDLMIVLAACLMWDFGYLFAKKDG